MLNCVTNIQHSRYTMYNHIIYQDYNKILQLRNKDMEYINIADEFWGYKALADYGISREEFMRTTLPSEQRYVQYYTMRGYLTKNSIMYISREEYVRRCISSKAYIWLEEFMEESSYEDFEYIFECYLLENNLEEAEKFIEFCTQKLSPTRLVSFLDRVRYIIIRYGTEDSAYMLGSISNCTLSEHIHLCSSFYALKILDTRISTVDDIIKLYDSYSNDTIRIESIMCNMILSGNWDSFRVLYHRLSRDRLEFLWKQLLYRLMGIQKDPDCKTAMRFFLRKDNIRILLSYSEDAEIWNCILKLVITYNNKLLQYLLTKARKIYVKHDYAKAFIYAYEGDLDKLSDMAYSLHIYNEEYYYYIMRCAEANGNTDVLISVYRIFCGVWGPSIHLLAKGLASVPQYYYNEIKSYAKKLGYKHYGDYILGHKEIIVEVLRANAVDSMYLLLSEMESHHIFELTEYIKTNLVEMLDICPNLEYYIGELIRHSALRDNTTINVNDYYESYAAMYNYKAYEWVTYMDEYWIDRMTTICHI